MKKKNGSDKKIIIAAVAVISIVLIAIFVFAVGKRLKRKSEQENQIESLKQTVSEIKEETINNGENESYIERVAREDYNYVRPEERIYYDSDQD